MSGQDEKDTFFRHHRGGSGAVILGTAYPMICEETVRQQDVTVSSENGIFSCIETAEAWSRQLGDGFVCVFAPYIVDDPDWGNEAKEAKS